jgi:hypothetical protein
MTLNEVRLHALHFFHEARTKVTTYVGLLIASAGEIRASWPDVMAQLPSWPWLIWLANHTFMLLGLLVIYTRIRRSLGNPK